MRGLVPLLALASQETPERAGSVVDAAAGTLPPPGFWAYSYSTCLGSSSNSWSDLPSQNLSACTDPRGFNRSIWGMDPRIGRGAPEIDLMEVRWV